MKDENIKTLPVTRGEKLEGLITIGDIATSYMEVYDNNILATARTQYRNIVKTLDGTLISGNEHGYFLNGKVVIAASSPDLMENFIEKDDLVILGNRYESQLCAIEMDASCLVICQGANISKTIKKMAEERDIVIIQTPHDTFTAARLINQSIPVKYFMSRDNLEIFHLNDYVEHVKEVMSKTKYRDFPILDNKGKFCGFLSRRRLMTSRKKQVILVDHNEKSQAVNGIEEAEVQEIIDHHRLGGLETIGPVYFRNQPVGCTATIIYQMYQESGVEVEPQMAGLLCSAIISDTLLFRSPTCTPLDELAAEKLAEIAGLDMEAHAVAMFDAGSDLKSKTNEEILYQDFKKFKSGDTTFGVGQVTSMNAEELKKLKDKMKPFLESARTKENIDMLFLLITDILSENSYVIYAGAEAENILSQGFNQMPVDGEALLEGVVSRKKQFVPVMMGMLMA